MSALRRMCVAITAVFVAAVVVLRQFPSSPSAAVSDDAAAATNTLDALFASERSPTPVKLGGLRQRLANSVSEGRPPLLTMPISSPPHAASAYALRNASNLPGSPLSQIITEEVNVAQVHDCVAVIGGVWLDATTGMQVLLSRRLRRREHTLRFCSITSTYASQFPFPMRDAPRGAVGGPPNCGSFAVSVGVLERPQHAMQFLFSVVGFAAMQDSFGHDYRNTVAAVSLASYGRFVSSDDIFNWKRFPHMELLQVLSNVGVVVIPQRDAMAELQTIGVAAHRSPWVKWSDPTLLKNLTPPSLPCIAPRALFGSLPVRVLHYKKQRDVKQRHAVEPFHFVNFRLRLVEHFRLLVVHNPMERYTILVTRLQQRRRLILNQDAVKRVVESVPGAGLRPVVVVDWEGMTLSEQLQLVINANTIIGVHGNGHAWDCFMPQGGLMVEFSSDVPLKNEVGAGRDRRNVGNLAGVCPISSYSFRCPAKENSFSRSAPPSHVWKEVDIEVSELQLRRLSEILSEHQASITRRASDDGFTAHVRTS